MPMNFITRMAALCATLLLAGASLGDVPLPADAPPAALAVHAMQTDGGVKFSILGSRPIAPAPTLFILALDAQRTLNEPLYRRCGNILTKHGFLCVSVDLPCHGEQRRADEPEGLDGWRKRIDTGDNPLADLSSRLTRVLDFLVAQQLSDPEKVFACGTSRGGFAALHFAAADKRVKAVAAYSPVTELSAVREFDGMAKTAVTAELDLTNHTKSLARIPVWIMIGDRDERVGTDHAIRFARRLSTTAAAENLPTSVELHVCPSNGHHTPSGAEEQSADWLLRQVGGLKE